MQLPQVTNQQITLTHPDFFFFFFIFPLNRGICNFLTTLIFLETEGIQLSNNCSSLVAHKKNNAATELPRLTELSQLTTGQMKPQRGGMATHCSNPSKTRPMPDPSSSSGTGTRLSPCPAGFSCPALHQQQDPLLQSMPAEPSSQTPGIFNPIKNMVFHRIIE